MAWFSPLTYVVNANASSGRFTCACMRAGAEGGRGQPVGGIIEGAGGQREQPECFLASPSAVGGFSGKVCPLRKAPAKQTGPPASRLLPGGLGVRELPPGASPQSMPSPDVGVSNPTPRVTIPLCRIAPVSDMQRRFYFAGGTLVRS